MKKLLIILFVQIICLKPSLFAQTITDTVPHNTEELKKQMLLMQKDISTIGVGLSNINTSLRANAYSGYYFKKASNNYFTGLALTIIGSAVIAGSGGDSVGLIMLGGGVTLTGFICQISAWANIKKAGKMISNSNR